MTEKKRISIFLLAICYYFAALAIPYSVYTSNQSVVDGDYDNTQEVFASVALLSPAATEIVNGLQITFIKTKHLDSKCFFEYRFNSSNKIFYSKENRLKIADVLYKFTQMHLYPFHTFW